MHNDPTFAAMEATYRVRRLIAEAERSRLLAALRLERKQAKSADVTRSARAGAAARPVTG